VQKSFDALVLDRDNPFKNTVKQHGTFQSIISQYGLDREMPEKATAPRKMPLYGEWKNPNIPKKGIYKLIGGQREPPYIENMDQDPVRYRNRNEKRPVWQPVTPGLQLSVATVMNN
jgi:hypothetical protein